MMLLVGIVVGVVLGVGMTWWSTLYDDIGRQSKWIVDPFWAENEDRWLWYRENELARKLDPDHPKSKWIP